MNNNDTHPFAGIEAVESTAEKLARLTRDQRRRSGPLIQASAQRVSRSAERARRIAPLQAQINAIQAQINAINQENAADIDRDLPGQAYNWAQHQEQQRNLAETHAPGSVSRMEINRGIAEKQARVEARAQQLQQDEEFTRLHPNATPAGFESHALGQIEAENARATDRARASRSFSRLTDAQMANLLGGRKRSRRNKRTRKSRK